MKIAVYDEDPVEASQLQQYLQQCVKLLGKEIEIMVLSNRVELYDMFYGKEPQFEMIVIASNGTLSLEAIEMVKNQIKDARRIIWFSDLDFSLRSYNYGVAWFSMKPVNQELVKKAFLRVIEYHEELL